jgi:UDP-glucose 4-epimerase
LKKNIVITGATGRIGVALFNHLTRSPLVQVFPVSTKGKKGYISYDSLFENEFLKRTDVILHLAWSSVPKTSEENIGGEWLTDIPLIVKMLQSIRSGGHKHIHFIFFSSAGTVYGKQDGAATKETATCNPENMYGWSKLHAEQLIQQFALRIPLSAAILRISNVYGIGSRLHDQQGIIPLIIKAALSNSIISIWGDGSAQKDYLYVSDLMEVIDLIIEHRITGVFNVCYGQSYSLRDIIRMVESFTNKKVRLQYTNGPVWDNSHVVIDGGKFRWKFGWKPGTSLEDGLIRSISVCNDYLKMQAKTNDEH